MKIKYFSILNILLALTIALTACGGGKTAAPATRAAATEAPTAAPAQPSVFTIANSTTFPDIDPSTSFSNDSAVTSNIYETLTRYNPPGSKDVLSPQLATSWDASDDSLTWTFHLREGVKFHDGTPFNSAAVKFSIDRTKTLNGGAAWIWGAVNEIETPDDYTIVFHLDYAAPLDLIASSGYAAWMISPAAKDKDGAWYNEGHDAGTGPYTIESYEPGQRIILTKFDNYWGGWKAGQFDKVVLEVVEDPTVRQQKIESGEADWTFELATENLASLGNNPDLKVVVNPSFQNLVGLLNTRKPPLDDPKVRQALSYSFPYEVFINTAIGGYATQARGVIPAGMYGSDSSLFQYSFELDKAKSLLSEAGHPEGGFEITMTYVTGNTVEQQAGELWKAELAKLGITLNLQPMAWEAQWDLAKGDPVKAQDVFVMYWWPTYATPYDFLFNMFHTEETPLFNLGYYSNADFDKLIDNANTLSGSDKAKAGSMFKEASKKLVEDAASLFIFDQSNIHIVHSDIKGFVDNPAYSHVVFAYELSR
jgi:peptide/nickel transport system substrate-binding protein